MENSWRNEKKIEVKAPIEKHTAGRPKKSRLMSCVELRRHNVKCEKCGQYGYNKKTCRNHVVLKPRKE